MFDLQVNVGCVPKKVMFNTALHMEMIHDHKDYGFDVTLNKFDWRWVGFFLVFFIAQFRLHSSSVRV